MHLRILIFVILLMTISGCLENDRELTTWQKQQVEHVQQQSAQNAAAARALVEADAQARQEMTALGRELQSERAEVGKQRDVLEGERRALATERYQAPIIAATIQRAGLLVVAALPLVLCWLLLRAPHAAGEATELEELLILELADEASPLLPRNGLLPSPSPPIPTALEDGREVGSDEDPA